MRPKKVFVPDFAFRHADGTLIYLEIVGFWTPEYLEAKRRTLTLFSGAPIIVAVAASIAAAGALLPGDVITYRTRLEIEAVLARLNMLRGGSTA